MVASLQQGRKRAQTAARRENIEEVARVESDCAPSIGVFEDISANLALESVGSIELKKTKSIGTIFKETRHERGDDLGTVSNVLRISRHYLGAIENMDESSLPEPVYAYGFVRSYAKYLSIDPEKSVSKFKQELYSSTGNSPQLKLPEPLKESERPKFKTLLMCMIALGVLGTLFFVLFGSRVEQKDPELSPAPTPELNLERASDPLPSSVLSAGETSPQEALKEEVLLLPKGQEKSALSPDNVINQGLSDPALSQ